MPRTLAVGAPSTLAHLVFRQILLSGFWLPRARTTTPLQVLQEIPVRGLALHPGCCCSNRVSIRSEDVAQAFGYASRGGSNGKIVIVR